MIIKPKMGMKVKVNPQCCHAVSESSIDSKRHWTGKVCEINNIDNFRVKNRRHTFANTCCRKCVEEIK